MAKLIEIDGRVGEGGGQLVRIAVAIAALTTQPIRITNIRGNRPRGGGLKSQHVASIEWLSEATNATVDGLAVGSSTLTFMPRLSPAKASLPRGQNGERRVSIGKSNASSTMLILQAMMPFLIFASGDPIVVEILGGTNVDFSPSYDYLDQVLLPTLEERWSVTVEREVVHRSWSLGPQSGTGKIRLRFKPLGAGQRLIFREPVEWNRPGSLEVETIDITIIIPSEHQAALQNRLVQNLSDLYPGIDLNFKTLEDSGSISRWYILLVAHSAAGVRHGGDILVSMPKKTKSPDIFISQTSRKVCKRLYDEISQGGWIDGHLRDQIVCYQALSDNLSSMEPTNPENSNQPDRLVQDVNDIDIEGQQKRMRKEKTHEPFGKGTLHAQTARWVASKVLPGLEIYNQGDDVRGIGFSA